MQHSSYMCCAFNYMNVNDYRLMHNHKHSCIHNLGMTLLFTILTKNASFRSFGSFVYFLQVHICNVIRRIYMHNYSPFALSLPVLKSR